MTYIRRTFIFVVAMVVLTSLTTTITLAQDPANGKTLWEEQIWQCQRCHGDMGQGVFGATLAGTEKTAQEVIAQVRNPRNRMPMFSEAQVSDEQLIDIHAYLSSLPKPEQPGFKQIELPADAPAGQQLLVEKRCVACHGETGPVQRFIDRGETPTAEGVIKQLRTPLMNMPSFREDQVSDEDAALIAEFMASEIAPAALPTSGSDSPSSLPMTLMLIGGALVITGLAALKLKTRPS